MAVLGINEDTAKALGAGAAALIAGLFGRSLFRRRFARDRVFEAESIAESDRYDSIVRERKEWHEREDELLARIDELQERLSRVQLELASANAELCVLRVHVKKEQNQSGR